MDNIYPLTDRNEVQVDAVWVKFTTVQCGRENINDPYKGYNQICSGLWATALERPKVEKDLVVHIGPRISQIAGDIPMHFIAKPDHSRPSK